MDATHAKHASVISDFGRAAFASIASIRMSSGRVWAECEPRDDRFHASLFGTRSESRQVAGGAQLERVGLLSPGGLRHRFGEFLDVERHAVRAGDERVAGGGGQVRPRERDDHVRAALDESGDLHCGHVGVRRPGRREFRGRRGEK